MADLVWMYTAEKSEEIGSEIPNLTGYPFQVAPPSIDGPIVEISNGAKRSLIMELGKAAVSGRAPSVRFTPDASA